MEDEGQVVVCRTRVPATDNPPHSEAGSGRRQLFSRKMKKGVDSPSVDLHNSTLRRISSVG
ncbi:hypothetical protein E2P84_31720 [Burkholderia cepacia]|uniref:Uncharacterized protein n=1 Tax=Burkholderia cepacia TaxID=292 RepID=A0AAX2RF47_BURCE|nr:hypothetical protein E2P84_31720 [Burkholderia cepacia]TET03486.1 hypothetical protein E3D36_09245 [Burkholderia cepacia]TEU32607.1 hypothetical protein E3D38_45220 [Burkholderia cepacia]TEU33489.1 hypothetical protein E3D39_33330 [Burkholderia cepacia]TEU35691.1 hypothetical protein E3D37_36885 [Burkholderia cepacia]